MSSPPTAEPRLYRRPVSTWWWTRKRSYFVFVMRELSSIFVAWFVGYLLAFVYAVGEGAAAYQDFLDGATAPWVVVVNVVGSVFLVLHVVTWFNLTPQAMDVRVRGRRVPAAPIVASQYAGLAVVSAFVIWLVYR
jgi:fumarate reductase subunit C